MKTPKWLLVMNPLRTASGLAAAALFALILSACSRDTTNQGADSTAASSTAAGTTGSAPIPAAINDVGTYGEDLYDQAKLGDWAKAKAYLDSLRAATMKLPSDERIQSQRRALESAISSLDRAVSASNRAATLEAANRVTYIAAEMTIPYGGTMPIEVVLLDYYGRELEIWAAQKDLAKLKETAATLESTWSALRPMVEERDGAVAVRNTDALVSRIKAAKSPADYASIATPFLDEVDELEKVFTKQ